MIRTPKSSFRPRLEHLEDREVPAILFGVTASNFLVTFDSTNPSVLLRSSQIAGPFIQGERITDIDTRPGIGTIFARSNADRTYLLVPSAGLSFVTSAIPLQFTFQRLGAPLGFDFDPRTSLVRVTNPVGANVGIDPVIGLISRVGARLTYAAGDLFQGITPQVSGLAFSNNTAAATFARPFAIDHARNTLATTALGGNLDAGVLRTIGGLGVNVGARIGFDIAPVTNASFASFQVNGQGISRLYTINLGTGRASLLGQIGRGLVLNDLAVDLAGTSGFASLAGFGVRAALPPATSGFVIAPPIPPIVFPPLPPPVGVSPPGGPITSADLTPLTPNIPGLFPPILSSSMPNTPLIELP